MVGKELWGSKMKRSDENIEEVKITKDWKKIYLVNKGLGLHSNIWEYNWGKEKVYGAVYEYRADGGYREMMFDGKELPINNIHNSIREWEVYTCIWRE